MHLKNLKMCFGLRVLPVAEGGLAQKRLEGKRSQFFMIGGGGVRWDNPQRKPMSKERELLDS